MIHNLQKLMTQQIYVYEYVPAYVEKIYWFEITIENYGY